MNPVIEFDSPRAFQNANGSTVKSSPLTQLSEDLLAERVPANPLPGEVSFLRLSLNTAGPGLGNYYTIGQTDAAIASAVAGYLPLSEVTIAATPEKVARRNVDGELLAIKFRGASLRATGDSASVYLETNSEHKGVEVARNAPGEEVKLGFYETAPILRPAVSESSGQLALDLLYALGALGLVEVTP